MSMENMPKPEPNSIRQGNIELLRVACMLLILIHHLSWHGAAMYSPLKDNSVLATFLFVGGQTGVNCFVMITGYFLSPFRSRRFFATVLETLFYSLGLTLLMKYTGWNGPAADDTVKNSVLLVSKNPYWFVTMYLGLNVILPFLQPGVKAMGKRAHQAVVILGGLYLSVIPTLTFRAPSSQFYHFFVWFIYLYVLGAYFKKYPNRFFQCVPLQGLIFAGMIVLMTGLCLWGKGHTELFQNLGSRQNFFADRNALPQLICSCALFLFFAGLRVQPSRLLSALGGASFGVYLIHDHSLFRPMLWSHWFQVWQAAQSPHFWVTALLAPPMIYLGCTLVDLARQRFFEAPLLKRLSPLLDAMDQALNR